MVPLFIYRYLGLTEASLEARYALAGKELLSDEELRVSSANLLSRKMERNLIQRENLQLQLRLDDIVLQKAEVQAERDRAIAEVDARLAGLRSKLIEWEASESITVTAPIDGTVTLSQVGMGKRVTPQEVAMTIISDGGDLEIRLLIPTRAIAFVEPGQLVKIMYDAFPYQQFGLQRGILATVSRSSLAAAEVDGPLAINEPTFLGVVHPDKTFVTAYGKNYAVQPGMTVRADVILKERTLALWLIEPLLRLRG